MDLTLTPTPSETQPATVTPGDGGSSQAGDRVDVPSENDVLCGRGGSINSHAGNENFRNLVEKRKRVYLTARFKREKRLIASSIVAEIRAMKPPGRFLAKKGGKDGYWYDIGDEKARDKTSQALRENAPTIRAEIETEINQQREEMKRREDEEHQSAVSSSRGEPAGHYAHPPHPYHYPQQAWDYYYSYYGYGHAPPPPPPPPPGHGAPGHGTPPPGYPPSPQGGYRWGGPPPPVSSRAAHEEYKEETGQDCGRSHSQEEEDHRMAMDLQMQEKIDAFEDRKRRYQEDPSTRRNGRSASFVSPGEHPPPAYHRDAYEKCPKVAKTTSFFAAMKMDDSERSERTQEEDDHRLAVALQEQEDNALKYQRESGIDDVRRTSRSNAYSKVRRANLDSFMGYEKQTSFVSSVPSSVLAWTKSSVSFGGQSVNSSDTGSTSGKDKQAQYSRVPQHPETIDERSGSSFRKSVQFKEEDMKPTARPDNETILPPPTDHDRDFSPIDLHRENSLVAAHPDNKNNQIQTRTGNSDANGQDSSLLSQVANQILGSLGSWDTNVICAHDSAEGVHAGFPQERRSPHAENVTSAHARAGAQVSPAGSSKPRRDGAFGEPDVEVSLMEVRDEMSMPPPEPRVQIDWPSRVGSCYSLLPETIGAGAASFFGGQPNPQVGNGPHPNRRGSGSFQAYGISPVHSLEMDNSNGGTELSCTGSIGGGSLCQVFDKDLPPTHPNTHDDMVMPSPLNRVLNQVPSWERSMRSKSPLSIGSVEDSDDSMIRVRGGDKGDKGHGNRTPSAAGGPPMSRHGDGNPTPSQAQESSVGGNSTMMDWEDSNSNHHPGGQ